MFYRIVALALVGLGLFYILSNLTWPINITPDSLEESAIGLSTIFLGLLNLAYVDESPNYRVPKLILLIANLMFIGFAILMVSSQIDVVYGYTALVLSVISCVKVINHKV